MHVLDWLLQAKLEVAGSQILWREIIGNGFGLASMLLGMRRTTWAWPIGMFGNALLFTVFLGGVFDTPQDKDLWGQAARQVFFFAVSTYGWVRWHRGRVQEEAADGGAVLPRWASWAERGQLALAGVVCFGVSAWALAQLGSWGPISDAWILTGSILATYGMARGYVEFWLVWIAVDVVGVPLLWQAGYYPSALLYAVYGLFCAVGFLAWLRARARLTSRGDAAAPDAALAGHRNGGAIQ